MKRLIGLVVAVAAVIGATAVSLVSTAQAAPQPTRSTVDRPGPNVWDVKVLYATFKGGPDSKRDTNGQLATLATNINGYFSRQRPGYQLRFDRFNGQLDIQHIALPVTAEEFSKLFTDDGRALEDFMKKVFADAGLPFTWGIHGDSTYGVEKRMYLMYMEGPRGIKYGNNSAVDYQCGRVSEFQAGARIVGVNLRDNAGRVCSGLAQFQLNKNRWWDISRDAIRFLAGSLTELPGCDSVTRDEIARPVEQRVENNISQRDVLSNKWMIPSNRAQEPLLDVNRNLYFNISSGPYVGDRCRDIQYSPFWQELPTTKQLPGSPKGRSVFDLPDENVDPKLKVYYVVPSDGIDRRLDVSLTSMMTTANAWLKNQTGQQFRWDTYRGKLDVMFVRLFETEAQLWQSDEPGLDCWDIPCPSPRRLYSLLVARGLVAENEIAVILYDGKQSPVQPRPSGCYAGERFIVGYSMCLSGPTDTKLVESAQGSLGIRIMHEVFHTLGAVGEGAPNGDGGFGHIEGNSNDIMAIGTRTGWQVDPGRDDYWGHGRSDLTDISKSVFLVPTKAGAEFPNRWNLVSQSAPPSGPEATAGRVATDRAGANVDDIKFVYLTFEGGPDSQRDTNGEIAGMADQVNAYFASQWPGHRLRFDTYGNRLDIQHVHVPITNAKFRALFTDRGLELLSFVKELMDAAGLPWEPGMQVLNKYGQNKRIYVFLVEGARGVKWGDGTSVEYECSPWDDEWEGIVMRFLRRLDGTPCNSISGVWQPTAAAVSRPYPPANPWFQYWGVTVVKGLIRSMMALPGCGATVQSVIDTPYPQRIYMTLPRSDMYSSNAETEYPLGDKRLASLDPARAFYFRIASGQFVGDRCRDIQYSPYWTTGN